MAHIEFRFFKLVNLLENLSEHLVTGGAEIFAAGDVGYLLRVDSSITTGIGTYSMRPNMFTCG